MTLKPSARLLVSSIPIIVLTLLLSLSVSIFKSYSILGASQVALLVSAGVAIALSMWLFKTPWKAFENGMKENMADVVVALVILLFIGAVSGTWTTSGVVPAFICYGIKIINSKVFLMTACIICAIVSLMTGSSWTTIATIGVALMGIGKAEGFSDGMIAGAIISGAYFGDKISPLSDTTVMEVVVLACCALHTVKGNASVRKKRSSTVAFFIDDYLLGLAKLRLILESWKWLSFFNPNRLFLHSAALFLCDDGRRCERDEGHHSSVFFKN